MRCNLWSIFLYFPDRSPCQGVKGSDPPVRPLHDLRHGSVCSCPSLFVSLHLNSVSNHFNLSHPITSLSPLALPLPPSISLPFLLYNRSLSPAEGYSCLQGCENVRKAHSISSYANSHFPPEQTHFLMCRVAHHTSHAVLSTTWARQRRNIMNGAPSVLNCHLSVMDCCHCPLYSSPSCSPFKQPRLTREKLSSTNSNETALSRVLILKHACCDWWFLEEVVMFVRTESPAETICRINLYPEILSD